MLLACHLGLEGYRVMFGRRVPGGRPFLALRGPVVIFGAPGVPARMELITPQWLTISDLPSILDEVFGQLNWAARLPSTRSHLRR